MFCGAKSAGSEKRPSFLPTGNQTIVSHLVDEVSQRACRVRWWSGRLVSYSVVLVTPCFEGSEADR